MEKTPFAGLTELDPSESLSVDNASFQARNPSLIDHFLEIGAVTHRHDAHAAMANPVAPPSAFTTPNGGAIPASTPLYVGYTVLDKDGGESIISPVHNVSTDPPYNPPLSAPSAAVDYSGGQLPANGYYYAITHTDGVGGETPLSDSAFVVREPGFSSGRVNVSGLTAGLPAGSQYRLWRRIGGGLWYLMKVGGAGDPTFVDDGTVAGDCTQQPPLDTVNTTNADNKLSVEMPSVFPTGATQFRVYVSVAGDFTSPCLMGTYPIPASAGVTIEYPALTFEDAVPPSVSTSKQGAAQIDPDRDILDWHWKRPVASAGALGSGARGDVRLALNDGTLWGMLKNPSGMISSDWTPLGSGKGGTMRHVAASGDGSKVDATGVVFRASGQAGNQVTVGVSSTGPVGSAVVEIFVPSGAGGGAGSIRQVAASGDGSVLDPQSIMFKGSGGVNIGVEPLGGSAVVHVSASGVVGPQGPQGLQGPQGPQGNGVLSVGSSAAVLVVHGKSYLEFRASGSASVAIQDIGGGSAAVTLRSPRGYRQRQGHTWAVGGEVQVPAGQTGVIPPFFVTVPPDHSAETIKARYMLGSGSASVKLQKNGADLAGYAPLAVDGNPKTTQSTQPLAEDDKLQLVVAAASGARNMSFTLGLDTIPPA